MDAGADRAGWREWTGLAVLMLPVLLISITVTVLFFALPSLSAQLEPTGAQQLWIVDIYAFLLAGLLIPMGSLGDRIGRRRLLLLGAAAFAVTSAIAAYAPSAELLIAARGLQGAAAATLMPSTLALIRAMFADSRQLQMAIALWAAVFTLGSVAGPIVGGWLLESFWWGAVFLISVPIMALLLVLAPLLPEYRDPDPGRFDILSAALVLLAALPLVYAVKQVAEQDYSVSVWIAAAAGLVFVVLFLRRQRRLPDPMLDLALFRSSAFGVSLIVATMAVFALVGTFYFITQYLMSVLGMSPIVAGLMTLPTAVSSTAGSLLGAALTRWVRPGHVMGYGMLSGTAGFLLISQLDADVNLPLLFGGLFLLGWGIGSVQALASAMVVATAPPAKAGSASGLFESATEFGQAFGAAILGSIGVAVYRATLAGEMPTGVPREVAEVADETLGGALAAAGELPDAVGRALAAAASGAYVDGMQIAAYAGAGIMLIMAVLAFGYLRTARIEPDGPAASPGHESTAGESAGGQADEPPGDLSSSDRAGRGDRTA
ncbi:MFS transporter [Nonomuraea antimicrobica]|uniref:MFS transporter n=1 Tax=Nonomuraea antimicrobica TaxID=561173 RepID=A0ABP7CIC1_9ACTN